jgi:hypothetical protein
VFIWKTHDVRPQELAAPSPLLCFIAGDFAAAIAAIWPHPHAEFLGAPASRRHLFCLALSLPTSDRLVDPQAVLGLSLKAAIRLVLADAPEGLPRALEHLGERAWRASDYLGLVRLLGDRRACKLIRHKDAIAPADVRALCRLPESLLEGGLGKLKLDEGAAGLLAEAFSAIAARDGEAVARQAAAGWSTCANIDKLSEQLQVDLELEPTPAPFPGTSRLRLLATRADLVDAAGRYKNCLRTHLGRAASGASAYYEWLGSPGAIVQIGQDHLYGWTLQQCRLVNNKAVTEPTRGAIVDELRSMGVRVGRTLDDMRDALNGLTYDPPARVQNEAELVGELFGVWAA